MAATNMTVTFGLVSIAAKAEVATITKTSLAYLCTGQPGKPEHPPSPRKQPSICETCGPITDTDALLRGVKSGQSYTLVDAEAAEEAKEEYGRAYHKVLNVVPHPSAEFLNATAAGKSLHYITPADVSGADHYQLLVRLITEHPELAFVGLHTPRSATSLYHLTVREGVLVMAQRTREGAVKPAPSVGGEVNDALYAMLDGALSQFVVPYDPATYADTYQDTLDDMIANGQTVNVGGDDNRPDALRATVSDDDIMAKLKVLVAA